MGFFDQSSGNPPLPYPSNPQQQPPGSQAPNGYPPQPGFPPNVPYVPTPQQPFAPTPAQAQLPNTFTPQPVPQYAQPPQTAPGYPPQPVRAAPQQTSGSAFDSIFGAETFGARVPFWGAGEEGIHVVLIGAVRRFAARKGRVDTYSVEHRILQSSNPKLVPGTGRCKQEQASKEGADGRIKEFIAAASGVPPQAVDNDDAYHGSYDESVQLFRGTIIGIETSAGVSQQKQTPYTRVAYRILSPQEIVRYAALAQQIDPQWRPARLQAQFFQG